jgi:hypothetical protein
VSREYALFIGPLRRFGRLGAVLALVFGAPALVWTAGWLWFAVGPGVEGDIHSPRAGFLAMVLSAWAVGVVGESVLLLVTGLPTPVLPLPTDELLRRLSDIAARPFVLCTRCRIEITVPPCPECRGSACCVTVEDDESAGIVRALLE